MFDTQAKFALVTGVVTGLHCNLALLSSVKCPSVTLGGAYECRQRTPQLQACAAQLQLQGRGRSVYRRARSMIIDGWA